MTGNRSASRHRIVSSSESTVPGWRWIGEQLPPDRYEFRSFDCIPLGSWEARITRPHLPRYRMTLRSVAEVARIRADVLVSHGPRVTMMTALAMRALGINTRQLAFAFNYTELPTGRALALSRAAFQSVDRFVVPSTLERTLYAQTFGLPESRFEVLPWGINKPSAPAGMGRVVEGEYICAIGGEGRDYATLFDAMKRLPEVVLVCVTRPHNLAGLHTPTNVRTLTNTSADVAWNILAGSRVAVIPLLNRDVPCGHVSMVAAMYHAKPIVATDSRGVTDYVRNDENALLCPPGDPDALADRIRRLLADPLLSERLGKAGERFVYGACTEQNTVSYFTNYLQQVGL